MSIAGSLGGELAETVFTIEVRNVVLSIVRVIGVLGTESDCADLAN